MLQKPSTHFTNLTAYQPPQSHNLPPQMRAKLKKFCYKKSIFNPSQQQIKGYAKRGEMGCLSIPLIQVIYLHEKWLLLQSQKLKCSFFQKSLRIKPDVAQGQLSSVFMNFCQLTKEYGYFLVDASMVFAGQCGLKVWISSDIFANKPARPVYNKRYGQYQFVSSFFRMISKANPNYAKQTEIKTIEQALTFLKNKSYSGKQLTTNESLDSRKKNQLSLCCSTSLDQQSEYKKIKKISSSYLKKYIRKTYDSEQTVTELGNSAFTYDYSSSFPLQNIGSCPPDTHSTAHSKKGLFLSASIRTTSKYPFSIQHKDDTQKIQVVVTEQPFGSTSLGKSLQKDLKDLFQQQYKQIELGVQKVTNSLAKIAEEIQQVLGW